MKTSTDVRIVVPHTQLHSATVEALTKWGSSRVEYFDVSIANDAYFNTLARVWTDGEEFIVIEHDIEIRESTIESLVSCTHEWCAFPYAMGPAGYATALGCTKFSASLVSRLPQLMREVGDVIDPWCAPRSWQRLDRRIYEVLTQVYDVDEHRHEPPVIHHNAEKRVPLELECDL